MKDDCPDCPTLLPAMDEAEQAAIADMKAMRANGMSLMDIRDRLRARGFQISHESVRKILARGEAA